MSVQITPDNLSKFNKRLHKALKEIVGDGVSLSQSAQLLARASGFKTLHDLQNHLLLEQSVPPPAVVVVNNELIRSNTDPHILWIEQINKDITRYAETHSQSTIRQWSWVKSNNSYSLQIEGDDAGFGLFLGQDVMSYIDKEIAHLSATPQDQRFIHDLASRFPTDPIEGQKLGLDVLQVCGLPFMGDGWYSIARHPKYTTVLGEFPTHVQIANLGEAVQEFAVIPAEDFSTALAKSPKKYADIGAIKIAPHNIFVSWSAAVQYLQEHHDLLLIQRLRQINGNKVWSGFYATAEQHFVKVKTVNGDDRSFGVGCTDDAYSVVRCQGFLAALHKLTNEDNPYGCNEIQHQLWRDGFAFAGTYPWREQFWIKPPR